MRSCRGTLTLSPRRARGNLRRRACYTGAMILLGQYDSPFVRRVGITLVTYGLPFEHRPWSTFGDAERIRPFNPLTRVPTLVLDDGLALTESALILDYLDGLVAPGQAMAPGQEPERHRVLRVAALAMGVADKAVSLFYEARLHDAVSSTWVDRCTTQIRETLAVLEAERAPRGTPFWFGTSMTHADVAVAVTLRFLGEVHPTLLVKGAHPALAAHAARHEAMPVFQQIAQPFLAPT